MAKSGKVLAAPSAKPKKASTKRLKHLMPAASVAERVRGGVIRTIVRN